MRKLKLAGFLAAFEPASFSCEFCRVANPGPNSSAFELTFEPHELNFPILQTQNLRPNFAGLNAAEIQLHLSLRISASFFARTLWYRHEDSIPQMCKYLILGRPVLWRKFSLDT